MKLYIMRHADAVNVGHNGITCDADRTLSDEGRDCSAEVSRGLAALGVAPDGIAASPLARARETAEIASHILAPAAEVEICDFLQPNGDSGKLVRWLREKDYASALIVGHMPDLARLVSQLATGGASLSVHFKKASVCCVSFDCGPGLGKGTLDWLLQPKHLKAIGRGG